MDCSLFLIAQPSKKQCVNIQGTPGMSWFGLSFQGLYWQCSYENTWLDLSFSGERGEEGKVKEKEGGRAQYVPYMALITPLS